MKEPFKTEADLCAVFIKDATKIGWKCYPETAGFDILAVNEHGHQCGIEAKLKLNLKVIEQIMPLAWYADNEMTSGPNHRAILVPNADSPALVSLLHHAGVSVISRRTYFDDFVGGMFNAEPMYDHNPKTLCTLPEYMPEVPAGVPSPVQLTRWKIGALRVMAILEYDGFILRRDFSDLKIDPRRWCSGDGWLRPISPGVWGLGSCPRFDQQHPNTYQTVLSELKDRRPSRAIMLSQQELAE